MTWDHIINISSCGTLFLPCSLWLVAPKRSTERNTTEHHRMCFIPKDRASTVEGGGGAAGVVNTTRGLEHMTTMMEDVACMRVERVVIDHTQDAVGDGHAREGGSVGRGGGDRGGHKGGHREGRRGRDAKEDAGGGGGWREENGPQFQGTFF